MWTLDIGAGWVLGVTHQSLAHDSAAAEDFEMESFNTSMAGLALFSNSFPCFAPWLRAPQASQCVQPPGNRRNPSPPWLAPALHVSTKGSQRRTCGFYFSAQAKCKCESLRNQNNFGGRNICQVLLNKTACEVRSREKCQEGASSLAWGEAAAGDPQEGMGVSGSPWGEEQGCFPFPHA